MLLVGAGAVGESIAAIAARRDFVDALAVADIDAAAARCRTVRPRRAVGGGRPPRHRGHGCRAGTVRRLRALRRRPPLRVDRRDRRARRCRSHRRRVRLRADVLDLDDDRGVPEPADRLRPGQRWPVHDRAVLRARGVHVPGRDRPDRVRERRARGGAAHPALDRLQSRDVQVRARHRVRERAARVAPGRSRRDRQGARPRRRGEPAGRGRRLPARSRSARRPHARRDLRRHAGEGTGTDGAARAVYLYHVVDNADSMRDYGCQAVAWQTALHPVIALELVATGVWSGSGVLGPEAFDAVPFLDLLADYGAPHAIEERPAG